MLASRSKVEGLISIPTSEQKTQYYLLCCRFTKFYLPVNIVRFDERTGNVFFLAGEENDIETYPNGKWRYIEWASQTFKRWVREIYVIMFLLIEKTRRHSTLMWTGFTQRVIGSRCLHSNQSKIWRITLSSLNIFAKARKNEIMQLKDSF